MLQPTPPRPSPLRRSPSQWWRLLAPPSTVLDAELETTRDARVAGNWLLDRSRPVELRFVVGNAGAWAGLHLGVTGFGPTGSSALAARRAVESGIEDAPAAFGWGLERCAAPGPLPGITLSLGIPEGQWLEPRDGVLVHTRRRLSMLAREEQTAVVQLALRLDPGPRELRLAALDALGDAVRSARTSRSAPPGRSMALAQRARDLHDDIVGLQAEVSLHLDALPGPLVMRCVRADLARDLGRRLRWDLRGAVPVRPSLLPTALAMLSVRPEEAESERRVLPFRR